MRRTSCPHARRGTVLIVTMVLVFALASITLVLCRSMRVEMIASANLAASLQASAIERGAEQYLIAMLTEEGAEVRSLSEEYFAAIPVGEGYFWVVRPNYNDTTLPIFGLVSEASKVNINGATYNQLMRLPWMTEEIAAAIIDWRDTDDETTTYGAESDYYLSGQNGYYCKNAPFETVEELLLVRDVTPDMLYGDGSAPPLGFTSVFSSDGLSFSDDIWLELGLYDLLTVYSSETREQGNPGTVQGLINVNTAPREVLLTLEELDEADVDKLIAQRPAFDSTDAASTDWVMQAIGQKANAIASRITANSFQYSANIVAVSGNGRGFRHVRIVIDTSGTTPQIVYRRDLTERGWPMDPEILASLRSGRAAAAGPGTIGLTPGGAL